MATPQRDATRVSDDSRSGEAEPDPDQSKDKRLPVALTPERAQS